MSIAHENLDKLPDSNVNCVRCNVPLKDAGEVKFATWDFFRLVGSKGAEVLKMLVCPRCGKVEMFV